MGLTKEFREFAMRGNVVDLAVGVIIGGAFGKIVASLVNDMIMPPIGYLINGVKFSDLKYTFKEAVLNVDGTVKEAAVSLNYGSFIQAIIDFLIIAFAVFLMIKAMNRFKKKQEEAPAAAPEPSKEEVLLGEIRDILKEKK